jgi:hypothetical protein
MRIDVRDEQRQRIGQLEVEPSSRPTRARTQPQQREVFLHWESAVDDAGHLRRCVVCGCTDLFAEKAFPLVTGVIVVLAFAGFIVGAMGFLGMIEFAQSPVMLYSMSAILVLDVGLLLFSRRRLVCYRCRSSFHRLKIARYHRSWDREVAEKYPRPQPRGEDASEGAATMEHAATSASPAEAG